VAEGNFVSVSCSSLLTSLYNSLAFFSSGLTDESVSSPVCSISVAGDFSSVVGEEDGFTVSSVGSDRAPDKGGILSSKVLSSLLEDGSVIPPSCSSILAVSSDICSGLLIEDTCSLFSSIPLADDIASYVTASS